MNDLSVTQTQLPETISDLATYDKYYSARQPAYRRLLREVKDWQEATDEEKRILKRAQDEADYLIEVRVKLGKLSARIPKASGNNQHMKEDCNADVTKQPTKEEQLSDMGITRMQASRLETLAKPENRPVIERVKAKARENNELVTQTQILKEIKKPHVTNNSTDNEWYTPERYIELARQVMGSIDLDPASNDFANKTVKASRYYTEEDDGLEQEWFGNIWMNPPYSTTLLQRFADKLTDSKFEQAVVLVNNATETAWFEKLVSKASAIVFHKGRIRFVKRDGEHGAPLQGQAFLYYGNNADKFLEVFSKFGWGARL